MSNYPNRRDEFHAKLNKRDTPYVIQDEEITISDGVGESLFKHDNVRKDSIEIWTEKGRTGERITSFVTETPSNAHWKTFLRVFASVSKVYVTYETTGDQVEADDVNELQSAISATQAELDRYKDNAPQGDMKQADYDSNFDGKVDRADVADSAESVTWRNIDGKPSEYNPGYHTHTEAEISGLDKYTRSEVDGKLSGKAEKSTLESHVNNGDIHVTESDKERWNTKQNAISYTPEDVAKKGQPGGYASLNSQGLISSSQIPANLKEIRVVETIEDRDALVTFEGLRVHVIDATPDSTVDEGWAEYLWTGAGWVKTAEGESIDVVLVWDSVENKPTEFEPASHTHVEADITDLDKYTKNEVDSKLSGKSNVEHTHTESDITNLDKYTKAETDSKLAGKADLSTYNAHVSNADIHVTSAKKNEWDSKAEGNHTHAELHSHGNKSILDKITQSGTEASIDLSEFATKDDLSEAGQGDMLKATYDTNNNGKVDVAETADSVDWTGVQGKPTTYPPSAHTHTIANVTGLQAELNAKETPAGAQSKANQAESNAKNASVLRTGGTMTGDLVVDGGVVNYRRPDTTGGWARGFWWSDLDMARIGGIGVLGSGETVSKFYIGYGLSPWTNSIFEAFPSYVNINGKLRTQQTSAGDVASTVATKKYVDDKVASPVTWNDLRGGG